MHVRIRAQSLLFAWFTWLTSLLAGALSLGVLGCANDSAPPSGDDLRLRFPEQAAQVLEGSNAFVAVDDGFTIASTGDSSRGLAELFERRGGLHASLPERGEGELRFHLPGGFEVGVREIDAEGEGAIVERAVAYRRQGGTSFWSAVDAGYEEWLLLDAGVANGDAPAAEWEVSGATLRQDGDAVEVAGADGAARLRVTAPAAYASGGRPVPVRLEVRGARIALWVDAGGEEVLVDPIWAPSPNMSTARRAHTATELANGQVLVAGGFGSSTLNSAELYDPSTNSWAPAGTMTSTRMYHTATRLADGRVLIVGGSVGSTYLATAELYNPATSTWTSAGTMGTARRAHTATRLSSGQVLIVGGNSSGSTYLATAERYNPATNTWTPAGTMSTQHSHHTATQLTNGNVLVAGGRNSVGTVGSVDIYDAVNNTWLPSPAAPAMSVARKDHTATQLLDGRVLVAGGLTSSDATTSIEIFDPGLSSWTTVAPMGDARYSHTATRLNDGRVFVAGGAGAGDNYGGFSSAEVYDPSDNTWEEVVEDMSTIRIEHTATLLSSGKVLLAGGYDFTGLSVMETSSAELYDPKGKKWTSLSPMTHTRARPTVTRLSDGRVLAVGGALGDTSAAVYNPATDVWTATGLLTVERVGHTATLLANSKVLVVGSSASPTTANAELFDPSTNTWTTAGATTATSPKRFEHTATRLLDGKVLITGGIQAGSSPATYLKSTGIFDPVANAWLFGSANMSVERAKHVAVLLQSGKVLVAGGTNATSSSLDTVEIYDPATNTWTSAAAMPAVRSDFDAVVLNNGDVLAVGSTTVPSVYNPGSNSWTHLTGETVGSRDEPTLTKLNNGMVLIAGGKQWGSSTAWAASLLFDPATNHRIQTADMKYPRYGHGSVLLFDGRVLAVGGVDSSGSAVSRPEYYTP
ncbi:Kelch repeat-containing protein [Sorangium sp. So ce1153]|uniref:Kelch repeat-containing protein n=1 Tax=Sorangium sp. So ce1153 TaxID=3133333 RepID=UPI003F622A49